MPFPRFLLLLPVTCFFLFGCSGKEQEKNVPVTYPADTVASVQQEPERLQVESRTYETQDSIGRPNGWGYDLYVNGKRTIHQPIIPAVSGNIPFHTEADARKTGEFAAKKMQESGNFPSVSAHDLDSLGITR